MQWPFYLSLIPDCFVLSGRHSSRCGNRVVFNNNGATAASLRAFGQCRGHGGRGSWTEGVNGVVLGAVTHRFNYFKVTSPQNVFFFSPCWTHTVWWEAALIDSDPTSDLRCFNVRATALYWLRRRPMTVWRSFSHEPPLIAPSPPIKASTCPLCSL